MPEPGPWLACNHFSGLPLAAVGGSNTPSKCRGGEDPADRGAVATAAGRDLSITAQGAYG